MVIRNCRPRFRKASRQRWSRLTCRGSASTTLRHSSASFLLHMRIPPLEVARILGHSSVTTTLTIYAHAIEEQTSP
ncbi:MAG: hypothetical protein DLM66_12630 [Candidatus Dormiibacter spiritus]|nr:MAG: hypothetical protein DLM66_12630 [Candidatus Dormibacteraeota bacterium]